MLRGFQLGLFRDYSEGDYDGACFNAEEAVQLAVKAILYRYFGEMPRIHGSKNSSFEVEESIHGCWEG